MKLVLVITIFIYSAGVDFCLSQFTNTFEFENAVGGPGTSRSPWRSNASSLSALHIFRGDVIKIHLCNSANSSFEIDELVFSNDGETDIIELSLANEVIGTFSTAPRLDGLGTQWNEYQSKGPVGTPSVLSNTSNTLQIRLAESDCYGAELDALTIKTNFNVSDKDLFCGAELILSPSPTPCAVEMDSQGSDGAKTSTSTAPTSNLATADTVVSGEAQKLQKAFPKDSEVQTSPSSSQTDSVALGTHNIPEKSSEAGTKEMISTAAPAMAQTSTLTVRETSTQKQYPNNSVQQLSFDAKCIEDSNVNINFHPSTLTGTTIIARSMPTNRQPQMITSGSSGSKCDDVIWQIGTSDGTNDELSQIPTTGNLDYDVNVQPSQTTQFPGNIDSDVTRDVVLRYIIPKRFNIKRGKVHFTLGLAGVTKDVDIGLKYFDRAKKHSTESEYKTFTPRELVRTWKIPARTVSPSLENVLQLLFHKASNLPISIDFLKLEYRPVSWKTPSKLLQTLRQWKIRGQQYKEKRNTNSIPDGMDILIDGVKHEGTFANVKILRKPNINVLTITDSGEVFVSHAKRLPGTNEDKEDKNYSKVSNEMSGFTFGNTDSRISRVDLSPAKQTVSIHYDDGNYVNLEYSYTQNGTILQVTDSSFKQGPLQFFSTYISDNLSAVGGLQIDGQSTVPIVSKALDGLIGQRFRLLNEAPNPLSQSVNELEVVMPKKK